MMTQQTDGTTRTRSTRHRAITVVVAAVVVAAAAGVVVTLTHAGSTTSAAATGTPTSTTASATSPALSSGTETSSAATSSATTPSRAAPGAATTTATSGRLVPQTLSDAARRQLVADDVRDKHYQSSWISGTRPGSVYYVLDTSTGDHLAWGDFQITSAAPTQVQIDSQDGGSSSALVQKPGGSWTIYDICTTSRFLALVGPLPEGGHC